MFHLLRSPAVPRTLAACVAPIASTATRQQQQLCSSASSETPSPSSSQHPSSSDGAGSSDSVLRTQLLDTALGHVKHYGWTHASLVQAARDLRLSPAVTGILPRGEGELVEHHLRACNSQLAAELSARAPELASLPDTRQRLALALRLRLEMMKPHMHSWPQALSVASQPSNLPHSLKLLTSMVDDVWHSSGASASDSSWYIQRALLAAVYTCTELYMLTDYSPGFQETWQALDRRLADMLAVSKAANNVEGMAGEVASTLGRLKTQAEAAAHMQQQQQAEPQQEPQGQQQQQQQQQQRQGVQA